MGTEAPKISLSDIEAEIASTAYMSGSVFLSNAEHSDHRTKAVPVLQASHLTICLMTLKNGFMLVGVSAPASPENYDPEQGRKIAHDKCVAQVWPLMGYMLREQLHHGERPTT